MEEWDAQKMLDLYIHDYLVRKNMHTTADILAQEADIQPKSVVINPPEGFLSEWWSLFWDVYSSRLTTNPAHQPTTSQAPQIPNDGSVPQNDMSFLAMPDASFMLHDMCPPASGMPNMLQPVNPTGMPRPLDMGNFLHGGFPTMMPNMDLGTNQFAQNSISIPDNSMRQGQMMMADNSLRQGQMMMADNSLRQGQMMMADNSMRQGQMMADNSMRQEQMMADFVAQRVREQEHLRLPPRNLDASNANVINVDQSSSMSPLAGTSSRRQRKASAKRQLPVTYDVNYGAGLRRSVTSEINPHVPKLLQDDVGHAPDAGRNIFERFPSEACSLNVFNHADNTPMLYEHKKRLALSEGCQVDNSSDWAAQVSKKLIIGSSRNYTNLVSPTIADASKGKGVVQIENNTEAELPMDVDISSFFSNEASDNMNNFLNTSAEEFPFRAIKSIHPSNNKLSCCDFSAQGKFLAAAGHEKKVFIWNLKESAKHSIEAHSQLITDVRFKPNSYILATSSFDRIVKIWDTTNEQKLLFNLVGHVEQVMSVDFHPRKTNLLCSCDCNEEIKLWSVKESTCFRNLKGANRQVRFQSRQGNLLAAAMGNVINLIDVETGMIQCRLEGHVGDVRTICWDVCGEYLVSTSQESTRIWSIAMRGKCIQELHSIGQDFTSSTFHPAYSQVVVVGSYESVYIWNPPMGNKTWRFPGHRGIISAMANAPDTNMMASVSHDQWVKVWK